MSDEYPDYDETTVRVRTLSQAPGDLRYRESVSERFELGDRRHNKLAERITRLEERQMSRQQIAEAVAKETEILKKKLDTLESRFWTMLVASLGAFAMLVLTKVFK